jgi:L-lactate dehydrogenase (cytochrome)/(S)-mandelate dehydrogenase
MVWAYLDGAAEDHVTANANREAFSRYALRQRVLTGSRPKDLSVTIAGTALSLPVVLAPTGLTGLAYWEGERAAALGAERAGTVSTLSTAASWSIEEVADATATSHWFQLYPWTVVDSKGNGLAASLLNRAKRAGYAALVVTVDVPMPGNREDERRTGLGPHTTVTAGRLLEAMRHPRWLYHFVRDQRISMKNLEEVSGFAGHNRSLATFGRLLRPQLSWGELARLRDQWKGPMLVKGILDPEDAERAVGIGVDGVIVSNHGGRQLDCAVATLDALPAISAQVGDRAQILLDGGVLRGTDIAKALSLGADAVCIGRAYVYGLAARGAAGVEHVLSILRDELTLAMTLMGAGRVSDLGPSSVAPAQTAATAEPSATVSSGGTVGVK